MSNLSPQLSWIPKPDHARSFSAPSSQEGKRLPRTRLICGGKRPHLPLQKKDPRCGIRAISGLFRTRAGGSKLRLQSIGCSAAAPAALHTHTVLRQKRSPSRSTSRKRRWTSSRRLRIASRRAPGHTSQSKWLHYASSPMITPCIRRSVSTPRRAPCPSGAASNLGPMCFAA